MSDSTAAWYALRTVELTFALPTLAGVAVSGSTLLTYAGIIDLMIARQSAIDAVAATANLQMVVVEFGTQSPGTV